MYSSYLNFMVELKFTMPVCSSLYSLHTFIQCVILSRFQFHKKKNSAIPNFYLKKMKIDIAHRQLIFPINQMYFHPQQIGFNHPHLFLFCTHMFFFLRENP